MIRTVMTDLTGDLPICARNLALPIFVAVQWGADHGTQGAEKVAAMERRAHAGWRRRRRVVEDLTLVAHKAHLARRPIGAVRRLVARRTHLGSSGCRSHADRRHGR
ncbi:hypothetical protein AB0F73_22065 [Micromonospora purpureochromogenes]|uniref:hypothetical protein n=1 Tax=Micromonospora purpureochromogenes TaxID=47872 RepID=UPI0033E6502E